MQYISNLSRTTFQSRHGLTSVPLSPPPPHVLKCTFHGYTFSVGIPTPPKSMRSSMPSCLKGDTIMFATSVPLAATAGIPMPGQIESPVQTSPGSGVFGPAKLSLPSGRRRACVSGERAKGRPGSTASIPPFDVNESKRLYIRCLCQVIARKT